MFRPNGLKLLFAAALLMALLGESASAQQSPLPANQLPDFLKAGARLSFHEGSSKLQGKRFVHDPVMGTIRKKDGQWYRLEGTYGGGGIGYAQLNILSASPEFIAADAAAFLNLDVNGGIHIANGSSGMTGNAAALGRYWVHPARLAEMREGLADQNTLVWRGVRRFGDRDYNVVSIQHSENSHYSSDTYDVETGIRLIGGTVDGDPDLIVTKEVGGEETHRGSVSYSHSIFVGIRQTQVPWANEPAPQWVAKGQQLNYQGQIRAVLAENANLGQLPGQGAMMSVAMGDVVGSCVMTTISARYDNGQGIPPTDVSVNRCFGSGMFDGLWLPQAAMQKLQPGSVLDEDQLTGYRTIYNGVQNNVASVIQKGRTDSTERYYDVQSGTLVFVRITKAMQGTNGQQVTEFQLAR